MFNQKVKFSQKVKKLNQDQLIEVIKIIKEMNPTSLREVKSYDFRYKFRYQKRKYILELMI